LLNRRKLKKPPNKKNNQRMTTSNNNSCFFQQRNARARINVRIARNSLLSASAAAAQPRTQACFCVDNSGSMASDFSAVLDAVKYIRDAAKRCVPSWILYSSTAELLAGGADELLTKKATGMTNFAAAIDQVCLWLDQLPNNEPAVVVFMTDGQNSVNPPPDDALVRLRALIAARMGSVQIHCIGFSASFDKVFLARLSDCGSPGSAVRAAAQRDVLNEQLGDLFDFFDCNLTVPVRLPDGSVVSIDAVVVDDAATGESWVQFDLMTTLAAIGHQSDTDATPVRVVVDGVEVELALRPIDVQFDLTLIESMATTMDRDVLLDALKRLQGLNPAAAPRALRDEAWRRKERCSSGSTPRSRVLARRPRRRGGVAAQLDAVRYDAQAAEDAAPAPGGQARARQRARFAPPPPRGASSSDAELAELRRAASTSAAR
jgi:hypothetical protein